MSLVGVMRWLSMVALGVLAACALRENNTSSPRVYDSAIHEDQTICKGLGFKPPSRQYVLCMRGRIEQRRTGRIGNLGATP